MSRFDILDDMLADAVEKKVVPSAVCIIGNGDGIIYKGCAGNLRAFEDGEGQHPAINARKADFETLYDLASVTKLVSTTSVALRFIELGKISLCDTLKMYFDNVPPDKADIDIYSLMTHTSGIPADTPVFDKDKDPRTDAINIQQAAEKILTFPLSQPTGTEVLYSCLGYITLGAILEKVGGDRLDRLAQKYVFDVLGMERTMYRPLDRCETNIAATEYDSFTNKYICGEVHDENARHLGGISANAGLFSCAEDMAKFGAMLSKHGDGLFSRSMFENAIKNYTPDMSEGRGLGFQIRGGVKSTIGDCFSLGSYGHTGYTGTMIFADPASGFYALMLSNKVHYGRDFLRYGIFRRRLFSAAISLVH